jgi:hypothetical protein
MDQSACTVNKKPKDPSNDQNNGNDVQQASHNFKLKVKDLLIIDNNFMPGAAFDVSVWYLIHSPVIPGFCRSFSTKKSEKFQSVFCDLSVYLKL